MDSTFVRGLIPALVTPMTCDEALDEAGLERLLDYVIAAGAHGVFAGGPPRRPVSRLSGSDLQQLKKVIAEMGELQASDVN